jgi:hypothetical protein
MLRHTILIIILIILVAGLKSPNINAQEEDWNVFEFDNCGISVGHPYEDDIISSDEENLKIISITGIDSPVAVSMVIQVNCSDGSIPITGEVMEETKNTFMTDPGDFVEEEISLDKWTIDGETAGSVVIGSEPLRSALPFEEIIRTNHNDRSYEIILSLSSELNWDNELYQMIEEKTINSLKFID